MRVLEKKTKLFDTPKATYDPALNNLPIPKVVLEKTERARKFLEEHPVPDHLLRK